MSRKRATDKTNIRRQSGAVAIWMAGAMVSFIIATFLAIDVGRLYSTQRDLQRNASLAAISAAQVASGCVAGDGIRVGVDGIRPLVESVLAANGGSAQWLTGVNGYDAIEIGRIRTAEGGVRTFEPLDEGDPAINAVRVNLTRPAPNSFVPGFLTSTSDTLKASSTAQQAALGGFYVGSGLLELDEGLLNALLGALLGANIHLTAVDYQALANVNVNVGALATALDVNLQDLSNLTDLGLDTPLLPNVLGGLVDGLGNTVSGTVRGLLQQLAGAAQNEPVALGPLLGPVTNIVGDVPFINLLDLIIALGAASQTDDDPYANPIVVPLGLDIPGVVKVTVFLKVLEPPQFGLGQPGEATAKTAQIKLAVRLEAGQLLDSISALVNNLLAGILNTLTTLLKVLTLGLVNLSVDGPTLLPHLNLGIDVNVAQGAARLDTITCPSASNPTPITTLSASPAVATVHVGSFTGEPSVDPDTIPALDTNATTFDVLHLGLTAEGLLGFLGSLNLNVTLDLTCISVGGACYGPSEPSPGPFEPLPNEVDRFIYEKEGREPYNQPYYQAEGIPPEDPVEDINPQSVSSDLDVAVKLGLNNDILTGTGLLGTLAYVLNALVQGVVALIQPLIDLVNSLLSLIVEPLLQLLGIELGKATVFMDGVVVDRPVRVTDCLPGGLGVRACPAVPN